MPNDPVIMDDGGSTRIKKVMLPPAGGGTPGVGAMDNLLDVNALVAPGKPYNGQPGSQQRINHDATVASYGTVTVTFLDSNGRPTTNNRPFGTFTISSGDIRVMAEVIAAGANAGDLLVTIFSTNGTDPLVDAKQHRDTGNVKRRRYIVANAKAIDQVTVDGAPIAPPAGTIVYTSVTAT